MVAELWLSCSDGHPQRRLADGFRLRCQDVGACVVLCGGVWVCEGVCQGLLLGIEAGGLHRLSPTDLAVGIDLKTKQNKTNPSPVAQVLLMPALQRPMQKDCHFWASLGYIVRLASTLKNRRERWGCREVPQREEL